VTNPTKTGSLKESSASSATAKRHPKPSSTPSPSKVRETKSSPRLFATDSLPEAVGIL
jgi:hypothetical protein